MSDENYIEVTTSSPGETEKIAESIGRACLGGETFCLSGDLGAGKTLFTKGLARGLDVRSGVTSPTFGLMNIYEGRLRLVHFDLYRIESEDELEAMGFFEYSDAPDGVVSIEWADRFPRAMPERYIWIEISRSGEEDGRRLAFRQCGGGDAGRALRGVASC